MRLLKKYALSFLSSVCILTVIWAYRHYRGKYIYRDEFDKVNIQMVLDKPRDCYKSWAFEKYSNFQKMFRDVQHAAKEVIEPSDGKNIFFHQTDCIHDGIPRLSARQACAVESAALTNPKQTIHLLYPAPVAFLNSTPLPFIDAIKSYPNVHIFNNNIDTAAKWTPANTFLRDTKSSFYSSEFFKFQMTDALKFTTLWKYGGTAMDLDVIVQKDLLPLEGNYAGAGSEDSLMYFHVLNLSLWRIGRLIANTSLTQISKQFHATDINSNGQTILNKVVRSYCGNGDIKLTSQMTRDECQGFHVLPKEEFYAYDWDNWQTAFLESELSNFRDIVKDSSVVHFTNQMSQDTKIVKDSLVGYNVLAKKFCPKVYAAITDETY